MNKTILLTLIVVLTTITGTFAQKAEQFLVNSSKSTVKWAGKKIVGGDTQGTINVSSGVLLVTKNTTTGGNFVLDTKSISSETASKKLVDHLKNEDFFDVEKFPAASFAIKSVKTSGATSTVTGDITIKGITKSISFPATFKYGKGVVEATANGVKVDRTQFGVKYNSGSIIAGLGDRAIEDHFVLDIAIVAEKK